MWRIRVVFIFGSIIPSLGVSPVDCVAQFGWFQLNSGTTQSLKGVYFPNFGTGCICTDAGNILRTTNMGANWSSQQIYTQSLAAIQFTNQFSGYTVSSVDGTVMKTTNSGLNWFVQLLSPGPIMYTLHFPSLYIGYTGGLGGRINKTTNGGDNWITVYNPNSSYIYSIFFTDNNTGYAAFFNGNLLKTTSGGFNWIPVRSLSQSFTTVYFVDNNTGWLGGSNGFLEKTTDGGASWSTQNSATAGTFWSIYFVNSNLGYACGGSQPSTLSFITKTTNQGANWTSQARPVNYALYSIFFTDSVTGYAVGYNGTILKTTTGGVTYFEPISNEIPEDFRLYQNFPNPFNSNTKFRIQIAKAGNVQVIVYDAIGRVIENAVDQELKPGTYEIKLDGTNYPSGVYYYALLAGGYVETRKLILLK